MLKAFELRDLPYPTMYFNMFQESHLLHQFELRTTSDPASLAGTVRRMVRDVLKTVPVKGHNARRPGGLEHRSRASDRNAVRVLRLLGAALAGIGLYGLLAYTVARRTNEIGIRMALGATASDVSSLVLRDALGMVCGGLVAGIVLVLLSRPLAVSLIQDLKPDNTGALLVGGWIIVAVALLAAYVPVRRAVRVDPMVALRHD